MSWMAGPGHPTRGAERHQSVRRRQVPQPLRVREGFYEYNFYSTVPTIGPLFLFNLIAAAGPGLGVATGQPGRSGESKLDTFDSDRGGLT